MFKVIDNFCDEMYFDKIRLALLTNFPWYYANNISYKEGEGFKDDLGNYGFCHVFYINDEFSQTPQTELFKPLIYKMLETTGMNRILRSRADMTTYSKTNMVHEPHVDYIPDGLNRVSSVTQNHISTIFYCNDSDGDTIFYDKHINNDKDAETLNRKKIKEVNRITPKANRFIMWSGTQLHTGMSPSKNKNRILVNSNFDV